MSRRAVSEEHLVIDAHLLLVSLPSKPSSILFVHAQHRWGNERKYILTPLATNATIYIRMLIFVNDDQI